VLPGFNYYQPRSLAEALLLLRNLPEPKKILAGGTDLVPAMRRGEVAPAHLVSLKNLVELRRMREENGKLYLGALVTFSDLAASPLLSGPHALLAQAAAQVGGPQIRNQGTVGGNVVNASPAGDLLPPLAALEAEVRLCRANGERVLTLKEFLQGEGRTQIRADEILVEVAFSALPVEARSAFVKLGRRNSLAISRLSAAVAVVREEDGRIKETRLCLGAVAPQPLRVPSAESRLTGAYPTPALLEEVIALVAQAVAESLGNRASAPYKRVAVRGVVREALLRAVPEFRGGTGHGAVV